MVLFAYKVLRWGKDTNVLRLSVGDVGALAWVWEDAGCKLKQCKQVEMQVYKVPSSQKSLSCFRTTAPASLCFPVAQLIIPSYFLSLFSF